MSGDTRARRKRRLLRMVGLAGIAGVAATGAVIVRAERQRRTVTPDEVREQLHNRLAVAGQNGGRPGGDLDPDRSDTARPEAR